MAKYRYFDRNSGIWGISTEIGVFRSYLAISVLNGGIWGISTEIVVFGAILAVYPEIPLF